MTIIDLKQIHLRIQEVVYLESLLTRNYNLRIQV